MFRYLNTLFYETREPHGKEVLCSTDRAICSQLVLDPVPWACITGFPCNSLSFFPAIAIFMSSYQSIGCIPFLLAPLRLLITDLSLCGSSRDMWAKVYEVLIMVRILKRLAVIFMFDCLFCFCTCHCDCTNLLKDIYSPSSIEYRENICLQFVVDSNSVK